MCFLKSMRQMCPLKNLIGAHLSHKWVFWGRHLRSHLSHVWDNVLQDKRAPTMVATADKNIMKITFYYSSGYVLSICACLTGRRRCEKAKRWTYEYVKIPQCEKAKTQQCEQKSQNKTMRTLMRKAIIRPMRCKQTTEFTCHINCRPSSVVFLLFHLENPKKRKHVVVAFWRQSSENTTWRKSTTIENTLLRILYQLNSQILVYKSH
jgi:hypothetical protein